MLFFFVAVERIREWWASLKKRFRVELKKLEGLKQETGVVSGYLYDPKSTWKYFDKLWFLEDQFKPKQSDKKMNAPTDTDIESSSDEAVPNGSIPSDEELSLIHILFSNSLEVTLVHLLD